MAVINSEKKEINFKIVYYGPALSGKTTSLNTLNQQIEGKNKSKVQAVPKVERTLFFDFMALKSSGIKDYKTRFQVYTVPGQPLYEDSRRLLLKGVDGVIFVADSQIDRLEDNVQSMEELHGHLNNMGYSKGEIPLIIQYNKRDLPQAVPVDVLKTLINKNSVPEFETEAAKGEGVLKAFQEMLRTVVTSLKSL